MYHVRKEWDYTTHYLLFLDGAVAAAFGSSLDKTAPRELVLVGLITNCNLSSITLVVPYRSQLEYNTGTVNSLLLLQFKM